MVLLDPFWDAQWSNLRVHWGSLFIVQTDHLVLFSFLSWNQVFIKTQTIHLTSRLLSFHKSLTRYLIQCVSVKHVNPFNKSLPTGLWMLPILTNSLGDSKTPRSNIKNEKIQDTPKVIFTNMVTDSVLYYSFSDCLITNSKSDPQISPQIIKNRYLISKVHVLRPNVGFKRVQQFHPWASLELRVECHLNLVLCCCSCRTLLFTPCNEFQQRNLSCLFHGAGRW